MNDFTRKKERFSTTGLGRDIEFALTASSTIDFATTPGWAPRSSTSSPRTCTRPITFAIPRRSACCGVSSPYATRSSVSSRSLRRNGSAICSTRIPEDSACGPDAAMVVMVCASLCNFIFYMQKIHFSNWLKKLLQNI